MKKHTPEFDYPSEETLKKIKNWYYEDVSELMRFIASAWYYPNLAQETRPGLWVFATAGWSGNENLLSALKSSFIWQIIGWNSIELPGGFLVVAINKKQKKELDKMNNTIIKWAWAKEKKYTNKNLKERKKTNDTKIKQRHKRTK